MPSTMAFPRVSVEVSREEIPVDTIHPELVPDDKWRHVDKQGHGHFWDKHELPTLDWVVTGTRWVGDEYDASEVEIGEYRCRLCAEVVEPKRRAEYGPKFLPGLVTVTVSIDRDLFVLTEEQYARAVGQWADFLRESAAKREP